MNNYPQSCRSKTQPNLEYLWQKASQTETETKSWSTSSHSESGQCKAALPSRLPWCRQRVAAVCEQVQAVHCATPPPTRCLATASTESTHLHCYTQLTCVSPALPAQSLVKLSPVYPLYAHIRAKHSQKQRPGNQALNQVLRVSTFILWTGSLKQAPATFKLHLLRTF